MLLTPLLLQLRGNSGDKLNKAQRRLAGSEAVDCGVGQIKTAENNPIFQQRKKEDACASAAFQLWAS